jgi:hypothetical protein
MATWATIADVFNKTGVTVDATQIERAHAVILTFVDVDPDAENTHLSDRDRNRMVAAEAFQAAWMFTQIEVVARTDVVSNTQDGEAFVYANPDAAVLAPLAKRNIDRLSWNGSGSVGGRRTGAVYHGLDEVADAVMRDEVIPFGAEWQFEAGTL